MSSEGYSVGAVAKIAKVTVRTLHHYDEIGLLSPADRTRTGYRRYRDADLDRLQQILFYRELGFPWKRSRRSWTTTRSVRASTSVGSTGC